jgi:hypothetical protein
MTNTLNNELQINLNPPNAEWTDAQWSKFREWIVDHLKAGTVTVEFTKKDGDYRKMTCTLSADLLPPKVVSTKVDRISESTIVKKENLDIVSVFDMEAQAWRSFIVKNVKNISFDLT